MIRSIWKVTGITWSNNRYASPGYFRAMNIAIFRAGHSMKAIGGGMLQCLRKGGKASVAEESNPVGRRFMGEDDKAQDPCRNLRRGTFGLQSDPPPTAYYPYWQRVPDSVALVMRTTADPRNAAGFLRAALRDEDPQLPIPGHSHHGRSDRCSVAQRKFQADADRGICGFGVAGRQPGDLRGRRLLGNRRRNEIGIRMALGAQRSELLRLVIRQGMTPVVLGIGSWIASALFLGRAIRGLLFERSADRSFDNRRCDSCPAGHRGSGLSRPCSQGGRRLMLWRHSGSSSDI